VGRTTTFLDHGSRERLEGAIRSQPLDTLLTAPDRSHTLFINQRSTFGFVRTWEVQRMPTASWDSAVSDFNCGERLSTITLTTFRLTDRVLSMRQGPVAVARDEHGNPDWIPVSGEAHNWLLRAGEIVRRGRFYARTGLLLASPDHVAELIAQLRAAEVRRPA
jgi:hypothetical protein